jgi:quinone-modifying oxidoreductase subunit QmoC
MKAVNEKTWHGWPKVRHESELDPTFAGEIASIPGGSQLHSCIQCGTCSGMCPLSGYMDYTPRKIIAMIRAGFKGEVLTSYTTWLCASCYACAVECPREIAITDIMYAAKRIAIRNGMYPKRFPTPILAEEFFRSVKNNGRTTESRMLMRLFARTNPFKALKQAGLGWNLFRRGRMGLGSEKIKNIDELQKIMSALENEHMIETGTADRGTK